MLRIFHYNSVQFTETGKILKEHWNNIIMIILIKSFKMTRKRQNPNKILTNAERCKRYREVNFEKHKKNDALNEKYKRAMLGAKTLAENAERLKQYVFKKKLYRQHKKEMASVDLSHTVEKQLLEHQQINQSTPISNKDPSTFKKYKIEMY